MVARDLDGIIALQVAVSCYIPPLLVMTREIRMGSEQANPNASM